jgi:hypothetical protein
MKGFAGKPFIISKKNGGGRREFETRRGAFQSRPD